MANEKLLIDLWSVNMKEVDISGCTDVEDILSAVITYLSELPTVDAAEVVHGRWIGIGGNRYTRVSQCSNCCAKYDFMSPYCPNCGAKMDGDGDG